MRRKAVDGWNGKAEGRRLKVKFGGDMNKYLGILIILVTFFKTTNLFSQAQVVPCQLTNADQDTIRLFPERTNYRTEFIRTDEAGDKRGVGGEALYRELEKRMNDKWDPIWETKDIPYVFYEILKGQERIGWVFGANQGWPGADNSQLMFAFDLNGRVQEFYYQKLPSFEKNLLQTEKFYSQFIGLTLEQFYVHDELKNLKINDKNILSLDMINRINDPTQKENEGFKKTLRGMRKVLVYVDDFKFENRIKKNEISAKVKYFVENKTPILGEDALAQIKKIFPMASRFIIDLVSLKNNRAIIEERLGESIDNPDIIYPVYVVYKDDVYKAPFVKGIILGYVLSINLNNFTGVLAIGVQDKEKGKILSFNVNKTELTQFKGLSPVHFYTKDLLTRLNKKDEKIDKIEPLKNIIIEGKDISNDTRRLAKKVLIAIDELYLNNYFKKDEIMKKMEEYLKKK